MTADTSGGDDTSGEPAPQRRVVRRVVRKPVVAPPPVAAAPPTPAAEPPAPEQSRAPAPGRRAARPPRLRLPTFSVPRLSVPKVSVPTVSVPTRRRRVEEPSDRDGSAPAVTVEDQAPRPAVLLVRAREGSARVRGVVAQGLDRASALPLPARAAALGLALGLVAVLLCWGATRVFAAVLGTPAGGRWGFLVLVVVAIAAIVAGARALRAIGAPEPGSTSLVAVLLVPVVVLGLFLGPSGTGWGFLIVPLLAALSFAVVQPVTARLAMTPLDED